MSAGEGSKGLPDTQSIMVREQKSEKARAWFVICKVGAKDRWSQSRTEREEGQQVRWREQPWSLCAAYKESWLPPSTFLTATSPTPLDTALCHVQVLWG